MNIHSEPGASPFSISVTGPRSVGTTALTAVKPIAERVLRLTTLDRLYQQTAPDMTPQDFVARTLSILQVGYELSADDLRRIPSDGPLIITANHPFGAVEGIILIDILLRVRPDARLLANFILSRIPQLRSILFSVDPFAGRHAAARNIRPLKEALTWVIRGGALGLFPAGEVAHWDTRRGAITESAWPESMARFIRRSGATVLPICFEGANSALFQLAGMIHKRLRTALLPHELLNKQNSVIRIHVGSPVQHNRIAQMPSNSELSEYLRMRTLILAQRKNERNKKTEADSTATARNRAALVPAVPTDRLRYEVRALPEDSRLCETRDYTVYAAAAEQIPNLLTEIGRLRELTFRGVGEGTGNALDIDRYDQYYRHLFVWNEKAGDIVGAYRLGLSDRIVAQYGTRGLYTRTLYRYDRDLIDQISPAIELGRSFVRPKYQREYAPLHLLWKGIGQFVARHRQYRYLFGPVSISSRYHSAAIQLMLDYLEHHNFSRELSRLIKPARPVKKSRHCHWNSEVTGRLISDLDEISALVMEIESGAAGIPVLLRHYLRLGGKVLGFNIDPRFSDAIDGLILVDLLRADPRILKRYFGADQARMYLQHHQTDGVAA